MQFGGIISIFLAIVSVAGLGVVLSSNNTKGIIDAITGGFSNSLKAALGH